MERDWACKEEIRPIPTELSVWSLISYDGAAKATLDLGIFSVIKDQTLHMTVYCPFWMINNTGLLLAYKVRLQNTCRLSQGEGHRRFSVCQCRVESPVEITLSLACVFSVHSSIPASRLKRRRCANH